MVQCIVKKERSIEWKSQVCRFNVRLGFGLEFGRKEGGGRMCLLYRNFLDNEICCGIVFLEAFVAATMTPILCLDGSFLSLEAISQANTTLFIMFALGSKMVFECNILKGHMVYPYKTEHLYLHCSP